MKKTQILTSLGVLLTLLVVLGWTHIPTAYAVIRKFVQGGNSFGELGILGTLDNFGLSFITNGTEKARVDTNGNFGIGTNNPSKKLHVIGTANITSDTTIGGNLFIPSFTEGSIPFIGSGGLFSQNNANFYWDNINRRLGIGTNIPQAGLQGVVSFGTLLWSDINKDFNSKTNLLGVPHFRNAEEPFYGILMQSIPDSNILSLGGDTSLGNAATQIRFLTSANNTTLSGTERMVIDSSGRIGIGTRFPNSKLQIVAGDIAIASQGNGLILKATDGPNCYRITVNNTGMLSSSLAPCP